MPVLHLPSYDITIGPLDEALRTWLRNRNYAGLAVLTDENTAEHCLPRLRNWWSGPPLVHISVPAGEIHKNLDTCRRIWDELFAARAGRNWCLLNLGGGVIGDMGGFCAATYKRGIDFIQLPTTLLSQVDASVGGKLGIDYGGFKNSIGLFGDPVAVWIDPAFLTTLPPRELRSGFAEMIKHALIADAGQWNRLQQVDLTAGNDWEALLPPSIGIKRDIVASDPYERGPRKLLNFGHTIGHAVESWFLATSRPLLHGEAIAVGMIAESWLSVRQAGLSEHGLQAITRFLLDRYGHVHLPDLSFPSLLDTMRQDKKNENASINFSLLATAGRGVINRTASDTEILQALRYYNSLALG